MEPDFGICGFCVSVTLLHRLIVCGFIRPEAKFDSTDALIREIQEDGEFCHQALANPELREYRYDPFLSLPAAL